MQRKIFAAGLVALLLGTLMASPAMAADNDYLMMITTNVPVQIPGHVLPAGKYNFRLLPDGTRVQISAADHSRIYGAFFVVGTSRAAAGPAQVLVGQAADNGSRLLSAWFFPGQHEGYALMYPARARNATLLAKGAGK